MGITANGLPSEALLAAVSRLANASSPPSASNTNATYESFLSQVRFCAKKNMPAQWANINLSSVASNTVRLDVNVDAAGRVSAVRVFMSSSLNGFDSAVTEAIRRCLPFPKPPNYSWPSSLTISLTVRDFIP
jgi:TonB family protein